jgi:hypothetical protein
VQITLSSVEVRLALSVDDCFYDLWNENLLKLFTILHVCEVFCVLFLANCMQCEFADCSLCDVTAGYLLLLNQERRFRLETGPEVSKPDDRHC